MEDVKKRLQEALNEKGWTASELAKRTGIGKGQISRYLHGQVIPKQSKVGAMAQALGVSPSWLLGFNVSKHGEALPPVIEVDKLNDLNREKLLAYYQALLDTQGVNDGDT